MRTKSMTFRSQNHTIAFVCLRLIELVKRAHLHDSAHPNRRNVKNSTERLGPKENESKSVKSVDTSQA